VTDASLIIPAAGSGQRMNLDLPKPFIEIGGISILAHTLRAFKAVEAIRQVIIPTSADYTDMVRSICKAELGELPFKVIEGGEERQFSIMNALNVLDQNKGLVIIHDAVRPFIRKQEIEACMVAAEEDEAAIVAVPVKDTIKETGENMVIESTPDRSRLWQAQTPQIFRASLIRQAYESAINENFLGTDDASLVERLGKKVRIVEGDRLNFKITYPLDLELAKLILE
jgi:2-C-methyl-D-erythritol 4-phosphate cytidylyltransferase